MTKLIVKRYRPLHTLLLFVTIGLVLPVVVWFLMDMHHWNCIKKQFKTALTSQSLWEVNQQLEKEHKLLDKKMIQLERENQIEKIAAIGLQDELRKLQDKVYKFKRELEFYHAVMESVQDVKGLNIQGLLIDPMEQQGHYRFKLILTYTAKSDSIAKGKLAVVIEGTENGQASTLKAPDMFAGDTLELDLKFKNFKQINERLVLPPTFVPDKVVVRIHQQGRKAAVIKKAFDWSTIVKA